MNFITALLEVSDDQIIILSDVDVCM